MKPATIPDAHGEATPVRHARSTTAAQQARLDAGLAPWH